MNKELKSKWVAELRSGNYKQGIGSLCDSSHGDFGDGTTTYCCLGVLGVVCGVKPERMFHDSTLDDIQRSDLLGPWDDGESMYFDAAQPETQTTLQRKLAAMNDNECTFAEIADWIESNVPGE